MIIILEGPDGSGKTTLAKKLQKIYSLDYHHEGPPPYDVSNALQYYIDTFDIIKLAPVVIDRFALGECVYGDLLRSENKLKLNGWYAFQHHLAGLKEKIYQFVCLPPVDLCVENWRKDPNQLYWDKTILYHTYARYSWFLLHYNNVLKWYDYTNPTHDIPYLIS